PPYSRFPITPRDRVDYKNIRARTSGVTHQWTPRNTHSSTKPMASSWAKERNVATRMSFSSDAPRRQEMATATPTRTRDRATSPKPMRPLRSFTAFGPRRPSWRSGHAGRHGVRATQAVMAFGPRRPSWRSGHAGRHEGVDSN